MDTSLVPFEMKHNVSALFFHGEHDPIALSEDALKLGQRYIHAEIHLHAQGHVIPTASAIKSRIQRFLSEK